MLWAGIAKAQQYDGLDTIPSYYRDYYYPEWYENCATFCTDSARFRSTYWGTGPGLFLRENYTPNRLRINGIGVLVCPVDMQHTPGPINTERLPEYAYVYQWSHSQTDSLILLDSARWDTIIPRVMHFPMVCDSVELRDPNWIRNYYCYVYDCRFTKPIYVDSTFYIGSTSNSNVGEVFDEVYGPRPQYPGITYFAVDSWNDPDCVMELDNTYFKSERLGNIWLPERAIGVSLYGQFLAIVDRRNLEVVSCDTLMGTVSGSGLFPTPSQDTITAIPRDGYMFLQWNDGNTENPRVVTLESDTSFTAYFVSGDLTVQTTSNNDEWGTVEGGGTHPRFSVVTITAVPSENCYFERWSDNEWQNPRSFTLTQDTTFEAIFAIDSSFVQVTGTDGELVNFTIQPNPAGTQITVTVGQDVGFVAEVIDVRGTIQQRTQSYGQSATLDISQLPSGTYIVRIATTSGTAYKKLVVK